MILQEVYELTAALLASLTPEAQPVTNDQLDSAPPGQTWAEVQSEWESRASKVKCEPKVIALADAHLHPYRFRFSLDMLANLPATNEYQAHTQRYRFYAWVITVLRNWAHRPRKPARAPPPLNLPAPG